MPRRKTTEEFIVDVISVHGDQYDYSQVEYVNNATKVTIICPEHGPFEQIPSNHLKGQGCPSCSGNRKSTTEEFIQQAISIHGNRYDYSLAEYVNNKTNVTIICPEHGSFKQSPGSHLNGGECSKCSGNAKSTTEEFIQKAQDVHGDRYDYSHVDYVNNKTNVTIICPDHGPFKQSPGSHLSGHGCSSCYGNAKSTTEEFIQKALVVHVDRYDYSSVEYVNNTAKITIICPKHGPFEQSPSKHLGGCGCPNCHGTPKSTSNEFIQKAYGVHGKRYNYSSVEYMTAHIKVTIICTKHGPFVQTPNNHLAGKGCPSCNNSKGEVSIGNFLTTHNILFSREYRFIDCVDERPLPFDFYLPDHNICIEFDGKQHFEPVEYFGGQKGFEDRQKKDTIKDAYCRDNDIKLVRIPYTEENITGVLESALEHTQ